MTLTDAIRAALFGGLALTTVSVLSGCDDDDEPEITTTLLHINDHHSHVAGDDTLSLTLDGKATTATGVGNMARIRTAFEELAVGKPNVLRLHAGDAVVGTLYYTLFKGEIDAAAMNTVCFDAFAVGNHEFDDGDAQLKSFIEQLQSDTACNTPVLSSNIRPAIGTPLAPKTIHDYIKPYTIKEIEGVKVGIVGVTIAEKTKVSSRPLETTQFLDETASVQAAIDELKDQGVSRIIVLSHYGYKQEQAMAAKLTDVDVIIGGDSHTLLGDFSAYGITASGGAYPTKVKNKDGDDVCIAQAWEYNKVVGELSVTFASDGSIKSCSGTPHLILGGTYTRRNDAGQTYTVSGSELDGINALISASGGRLYAPAANAGTQGLIDGYSSQVNDLKKEVVGTAAELLCLERVPGQGYSKTPGCADATRSQGSDISMLVAHAFREQSITSEISIQNGGGVRIDVPAGDVSINTAYTLLPFSNTLTELSMTGAEIKQVLEEAVENATKSGGSTGAYPYAAGLRWTVDLSKPFGSRFSNLEFKGKTDAQWAPLSLTRTYKVVTNNFLADGGDGYLTFKTVKNDGRALDTYLDYAQSFVDYTKKVGTLSKLPRSEYSTQVFINKDGLVQ